MRKMKNSGIEWIGEIPDDWEVNYFSCLFSEHKERNEGMKETNLLSLSYGKIVRKNIDDNEGLLPMSFETYNVVYKDNIIFRLTDLQNDKRSLRTALCKEKGIITSAYIAVKLKENENSNYMQYLFHSYDVCKVFYGLGAGIRQGMNYNDLKKMPVLIPPIDEQQKIADYLDKRCENIDGIVELQNRIIEKLKEYKQSVIMEAVTKGLDPAAKMKNSGVEWIGEIPENWEVNSTKRIFKIISGATPKSDNPEYWEGDIKWITPADYKTEQIYIYNTNRNITQKGLESCSSVLIPENSIIFSKRAPIGLVAINKVKLCTNQGCLSCVNINDFNIKYFYYVMAINTKQYELLGTGTTFKEISLSAFSNYNLPCPPIDEQQKIADYLDAKCAEIDRLIEIKQKKIEKLQDYKKSLIYECVTGKREVS